MVENSLFSSGSRQITHGRSETASDSVQRDGVSLCAKGPVLVWSSVLWSGVTQEEKTGSTLRKILFILKRKDGLRDFAVFDSEYVDYRDENKKYVFEIISVPIFLRDQDMMVHMMSRKDIKLAAVELGDQFGS
jgi:hypothetical protein